MAAFPDPPAGPDAALSRRNGPAPSRRALLGTALAAAAAGPAAAQAPEPCPGPCAFPDRLDDASRLNATPVARHIPIGPDPDHAVLARLRAEMRDAAAHGRPVCIGGARHSMGGQSLVRGGSAITFRAGTVTPDRAAGTYRATAGARWRDVIAALDPLGLSPTVMQSNNDFGVAGTFSVSAHGWAVPHGPFASTVRAIRLMLADGEVVTCSREENAELFRLAAGGYGLVGIVLDLDVAAAPNALLGPTFERMPAAAFAGRFLSLCADPAVAMAYGRLDVSARNFLGEALMVGYRASLPSPGPLPRAAAGGLGVTLARQVYRGQIGSEGGKRRRWYAETVLAPRGAGAATRNRLLNEPVSGLGDPGPGRTDILHEYFVPPDCLADFLAACRAIIPRSRQDLLNVTLRYVGADDLSLLSYAPAPRIAAVLSFPQRMTVEAEDDMRDMTRALLDAILPLGASFYLPYRLHARRDQMERAYPRAEAFADLKRRHDPRLLFRNALWDTLLAPPGLAPPGPART